MLLSLSIFQLQCLKSTKPGIPPEVRSTMDQSGLNSPNFLKILLNYRQAEDTLQLYASYFLIQHMMGHYGVRLNLVDSIDSTYVFPPEAYESYHELKDDWDATEKMVGELHYEADSFSPDVFGIQHDFFINNLDSAMMGWQHSQYGSSYNIDYFHNWILPYRVANEMIEPFRARLSSRYANCLRPDVKTTAHSLNQAINETLIYDDRYKRNINTRSLEELEHTKRGNLEEISVYKVKALRSLGLAASMDYIPYFADSSSNLMWTTLLLPDGKEIPLHSNASYKSFLVSGRVPKVYRRTYVLDSTSLFSTKKIDDHTPPYLGHFPYIDVTNSYVPTHDIEVAVRDTLKYVYLSVWNAGVWNAVDWSSPSNDKAIFKEMGCDIIYLAQRMHDHKLYAVSQAFLLDSRGEIHYFGANNDDQQWAYLKMTDPWNYCENGKTYNVYHWDNGWKLSRKILNYSESKSRIKLPLSGLFLISENDKALDENRIFVLDAGGKQVFY